MQKNSTAQEVLFSKPLQWKTFQATKTKNQSVVRSFEDTIAPGRTITPGAWQQFRSGSEPAAAQSPNFLKKGQKYRLD